MIYYQNWLEVVRRIDQLQLELFLIVFTCYWLYHWYGHDRFKLAAAGFSLVTTAALIEPLLR